MQIITSSFTAVYNANFTAVIFLITLYKLRQPERNNTRHNYAIFNIEKK